MKDVLEYRRSKGLTEVAGSARQPIIPDDIATLKARFELWTYHGHNPAGEDF